MNIIPNPFIENHIKKVWDDNFKRFHETIDEQDFRVQALKKEMGSSNNISILEVGCGKGRLLEHFYKGNAKVFGLDLSKNMLASVKKEYNPILGSATAIPLKSNSIDLVYAVEALEQIPNTLNVVEEMIRVLKPKGCLLIIDRNKLSVSNKIKENILCRKLKLPILVYLHHKYHEFLNHHLYKRDSPFKEIWFYPWTIKSIFKRHCNDVKIIYLDKNSLNYLLPFTSHFILWKGDKSQTE